MALTFSAEAYQNLWETSPLQSVDATDWIQACPAELGRGHRRWVQLRRGILLLIHDYELRENIWVGGDEPKENYPWLEFGFRLSGLCSGETGSVRGADEVFLCVNGLSDEMTQRLAGQRTVQVDIHFTEPSLILDFLTDRLEHLPANIQELFGAIADASDTASIPNSLIQSYNDICQHYIDLHLSITPAIRLAIQQLFHCPHHSITKQLYLEGKSLELVALALEQLLHTVTDPDPTRQFSSSLRSDDVERLHQARDILQRNLENPPSLVSLARQVGLNDYKLKAGFRQVFNTTVFGYVRDRRLEQAQQLLIEHRMSVTEVCNTVGYTSLSSFNAAFRKKFGYNPSACWKSGQRSLHRLSS